MSDGWTPRDIDDLTWRQFLCLASEEPPEPPEHLARLQPTKRIITSSADLARWREEGWLQDHHVESR
jgi:hypothetical protein